MELTVYRPKGVYKELVYKGIVTKKQYVEFKKRWGSYQLIIKK